MSDPSADDGHISEYQFSPDVHRDISNSHVSWINQWKDDISARGKTNVYLKQISLDYLNICKIKRNNENLGHWTSDCKIINTCLLPLCHIWYTYLNVSVSFRIFFNDRHLSNRCLTYIGDINMKYTINYRVVYSLASNPHKIVIFCINFRGV